MISCHWSINILRNYYQWFKPKKIEIPNCVLQLLITIYPTVNWKKVHFYDKLPWFIPKTKASAVALPGKYDLNQIHIFFNNFNPYTCISSNRDLSLIVHEGFHALQYTEIGTYGFGFLRLFIIKYLAYWLIYGYKKNPFEIEAYEYAEKFNESCKAIKLKICEKTDNNYTFNKKALTKLVRNFPDLIIKNSKTNYKCGFLAFIGGIILNILISIGIPFVEIILYIGALILTFFVVITCLIERFVYLLTHLMKLLRNIILR